MTDLASDITKENMSKYPCQPSWDIIQSFLDEVGMGMTHCERFYGIPYNVLCQVKSGKKLLPIKYWHIFYEKIKTPYGLGFVKEYEKKQKAKLQPKIKRQYKKRKDKPPIFDMHDRLSKIK